MSNHVAIFESFQHGLIVSCQAMPDEPLYGSAHMLAMARAALQGGAMAIRANGPADIAAIHAALSLPIIGLYKQDIEGFEVRITPTFASAVQLADAGADILAIDASSRPRPDGRSLQELINDIHAHLGKPVLADISTFDEALLAVECGADAVATTLSGYTSYSPAQSEPDFVLLERLVAHLKPVGIPVIAEGRIATPAQAARALALGAWAVVVGGAITRPQWISAQFVAALRSVRS